MVSPNAVESARRAVAAAQAALEAAQAALEAAGEAPPVASHTPLTVEEAAAELRVSRSRVWELIAAGCLASTRPGRRRLVPRAAVDALVAELTDGAA